MIYETLTSQLEGEEGATEAPATEGATEAEGATEPETDKDEL